MKVTSSATAGLCPSPHPSRKGEAPRRDKLAGLEGLRGLLALVVCLGHYGLNDALAPLGLHVRFDLAVDVFFAISGFVLSRAYYLGRRGFRDLAVGRIARLYPLHLLTLLWCLWLSHRGGVEWPLLVQNLLLVQNIGLPPNRWAFDFPSWSISVEMAVSLTFFLVMRRGRPGLAGALLIGGIALSAYETASGLTPALNHHGMLNSGLMRGIAGFALGAAAYSTSERNAGITARLGAFALPLSLLLLAFFLIDAWPWPVGAVFALVAFLAVLAIAGAAGVPVLASRPFVWLGAVSYSVYLLHIPLLWSANAALGRDVAGFEKLPLLAVVLAAAHLSYRAFELPVQRAVLGALSQPATPPLTPRS
jgi:peptidoglycan/LPS O-acetylase OafA/YrhL